MAEPICLDCERPVLIAATLEVGATFNCRHCQTELELVSLEPLKVDWPHDDTYDDWDGEIEEDDEDEWLEEDDEEWFDEDDDYSWILSKQKRHQEPSDVDRRRQPRQDF